MGSKKKLEDTIVALALSKDKFETKIEKLPSKEDSEHLVTYSKIIVPKMNNDLVNVMHKLRLCQKEFLEKDGYLDKIAKKSICVSDLLRKDSSFKHVKEVPIKQQVWVKREKEVEEVKMLSEVKDPFLAQKIVACMN